MIKKKASPAPGNPGKKTTVFDSRPDDKECEPDEGSSEYSLSGGTLSSLKSGFGSIENQTNALFETVRTLENVLHSHMPSFLYEQQDSSGEECKMNGAAFSDVRSSSSPTMQQLVTVANRLYDLRERVQHIITNVVT